MKKIFKIIMITVIMSILCVLILFCTKQYRISLIENIKQKIAKTEENTQNINEVTTVDVTNLEDNGNMTHEHIFKTKYDENSHWEECIICGLNKNKVIHSYTRTWALGYESCDAITNYYTDTCKCGYSYIGYKPCVWNGKSYRCDYNSHIHLRVCNYGHNIYQSYYLNGTLYKVNTELDKCRMYNGTILNCSTLGKCNICGYNYTTQKHQVSLENKVSRCYICNTEFATAKYEPINRDNCVPGTYTTITKVSLKNGATYKGIVNQSQYENFFTTYNVTSLESGQVGGTDITVKTTATFKANCKQNVVIPVIILANINGGETWITVREIETFPDCIEPNITSITTENSDELNEWSKTKPIVITGTENYCNTINIKIFDIENEKNIIFEGETIVDNNHYSISCIPEIECDANGKKFKVIATDSCQNSTEQEFIIAKVDIIPPKPTSNEEVGGEWAKSKDFTFTATDYGIGQVSIAFNDIKDLKLAKVNENTFSRDYKFTGDVYTEKQLSVMYKDGLGNISMQKITIDKIDNTAPTITNAELHNNKITIIANDEHETLGEGSGVVKYRYLASEEKLENSKLTNENSTEVLKDEEIKIKDIYKMKYIYAVAEDYVGNISEVYEFKVPELKLTATANTENGKGEIILDWSSYDVTDKYFVIYRKKEEQEEWEEIVALEQKLTGSTYIDILANDESNPKKPSITIIGDTENNNINITSTTSDNGTEYIYYVEAYDSTGTLLSKSY